METEAVLYTGTVETLVEGKHGPYFVARVEGWGFMTASLERPVWREEQRPEPGTMVVLGDVRKKRRGWRAYSARFFRPEDEQTTSKEKGEPK